MNRILKWLHDFWKIHGQMHYVKHQYSTTNHCEHTAICGESMYCTKTNFCSETWMLTECGAIWGWGPGLCAQSRFDCISLGCMAAAASSYYDSWKTAAPKRIIYDYTTEAQPASCSMGKRYSSPVKESWRCPERSRKLRFPDYMTTAQDGGKVVSHTHRPPLPQEILLELC